MELAWSRSVGVLAGILTVLAGVLVAADCGGLVEVCRTGGAWADLGGEMLVESEVVGELRTDEASGRRVCVLGVVAG